MRTILSRALAELNAHRSVVLVTIVAEQGSAPRGPRQSNAGGCGRSANGHYRRRAGRAAVRAAGPVPAEGAAFPDTTLRPDASRGGQSRHGLWRGCDGTVSVHLPGGHPLAECVGNGAGPAHRRPARLADPADGRLRPGRCWTARAWPFWAAAVQPPSPSAAS